MSAKNYAKKTRSQSRRATNRTTRAPSVAFRLTTALERIADVLTPDAISVPVARKLPRFAKVSSEGKLLPDSATDWIAVYDREQDLVFSRGVLGTSYPWKAAMDAIANTVHCGVDGWEAPTLMQRFRICDHSRVSPALDTNYFASDAGWEWTSTVDAEDPSDYAWVVGLGGGDSSRCSQGYHYLVRAVRAGQLFGFSPSVSA